MYCVGPGLKSRPKIIENAAPAPQKLKTKSTVDTRISLLSLSLLGYPLPNYRAKSCFIPLIRAEFRLSLGKQLMRGYRKMN